MTCGVIVVGGGMVGISTALWLQRLGRRVTLIDRGDAQGRASYGNAGVLAAASVVPVTVPGMWRKAPRMALDPNQPLFLKWAYMPRFLPFGVKYLAHCNARDAAHTAAGLQPILANALQDHQTLAAGTVAAQRITPTDFKVIYPGRAGFEKDAFGWGLRRDNGYVWDELTAPELQQSEPSLAPDLGFAAVVPNHGRINDPGAYIQELTDHFRNSGGTVINGEAEALIRDGARVVGVSIKGQALRAEAVAITAGAWSALLTRELGLRIPLESERGYHIEFWGPNIMPNAPCLITRDKFILTPMQDRLRAAGIVEFGGLKNPPSKAPFDLLRRNVLRALPGLTWTHETTWMGHRPATANSLPLISAVPGVAGVYLGFGHQHVGLTGGPRTGQLLAQMITGASPNIDMQPYVLQ